MTEPRPWTDPPRLAAATAAWSLQWSGRDLFRVAAGPGWVRLHLAGDERPAVMLTTILSAKLCLAHEGPLDPILKRAFEVTPRHPLQGLLKDARFTGCGMLPEDRVAAFRFETPAGDRFLLHQMFGARGNTVLLDTEAKLLWSLHRPPHAALAAVPPDGVWAGGEPGGDSLSGPALDHLTAALLQREITALGSRLRPRLKTADRLVGNLTRDHDNAEKGDLFRQRGEALAAHLHTLSQGTEEITVTDPRTGDPLTIPLDPALTPAANMDKWFQRARKAEKGREIVAERLEAARAELAALEAAEAGLRNALESERDPLDRLAALQEWQDEHPDLARPAKRGPRGRHGPEEPARPFRRYLIDGRWEAWVGRSRQENDELTHRASHVKDIWLHAQGVSGSHVILRTEGKPEQVPQKVIAKAAGLAAQHSKARHAGLVPVVWTERRYVRKPRKAAPGTAVCLQEKSLFVKPGVGPDVVPI